MFSTHSFSRPPFQSLWGKVDKIQCPLTLIEGATLRLEPMSLKLLMLLFWLAKHKRRQSPGAAIKITGAKIGEYVGSNSAVTIHRAIRELEAKNYVQVIRGNRKKNQRVASNEYILLNPVTGAALESKPGESLLWGANGIGYFHVPACIFTDKGQPYAIAQISNSAMRVYTAALCAAKHHRRLAFETSRPELRRLAGVSANSTFEKAVDELRDMGLLWSRAEGRVLKVELLDPQTGSTVYTPNGDDADNPKNYRAVEDGAVSKRSIASQGSPAQNSSLIRSLFSNNGPVSFQRDGQAMVHCCFHADSTPSLSIGIKPRFRFNCFGCGRHGGDITDIIMAVRGCQRAEAMTILEQAYGQQMQFVQSIPPKEAEVRYYYRDVKGTMLKLVRRFMVDGSKSFDQWKPAPGGDWVPNVQGVGPCLYNADRLFATDTVILVEGERDVTSVMDLGLISSRGCEVLGVTSGSATSWDPSLAQLLKNKRVILMGDADEAGERYVNAVAASLKRHHIDHVRVTLVGTGHKDLTDFLEANGVDELLRHLHKVTDWVHHPQAHSAASLEPEEVFAI